MKKLLFIITLFLPLFYSAQNELDSLWSVWNDETKADSNRLEALGQYAWNKHLFKTPDSAFILANDQISYSKKVENKKYEAVGYNIKAAYYYVKSDFDSSIFFNLKSLNIRKEINDISGVASSLNNIANIHMQRSDYNSAIVYYEKSIVAKKKLGIKGF